MPLPANAGFEMIEAEEMEAGCDGYVPSNATRHSSICVGVAGPARSARAFAQQSAMNQGLRCRTA
jgi:hypothetical protein